MPKPPIINDRHSRPFSGLILRGWVRHCRAFFKNKQLHREDGPAYEDDEMRSHSMYGKGFPKKIWEERIKNAETTNRI